MKIVSLNRQCFLPCRVWLGMGLVMVGIVGSLFGAEPSTPATPADAALKAINQAISAKQYVEARTLSQSFLAKFGTDKRVPEVLFLKGQAEFRADNKPAAQNTWQSLITTYSRTDAAARALEQLIPLAELKNQMTERATLRDRLLKDFPDHPATVRIYVADGEAKAKRGEFATAITDYQQVVARLSDPQKKRLQELVILAARPEKFLSEQDKLVDLMKRAEQLAKAGSCGEAAKLYAEVSRQFGTSPQAAEAHYRRGLCLSQSSSYRDAITAWQATLELKVGEQWQEAALLEIARTQAFKLKEYDKAIVNYKQFLRRYPKSSRQMEVEYQLAGVFYTKKDYTNAQPALVKFIADYPNTPIVTEAKDYLAKCDKALQAITAPPKVVDKSAPDVAPSNPEPAEWMAKAQAALRRNDYRDAYSCYERVFVGFKLSPEYEPAMYHGGRCLREMGDLPKAARLWEDFVRAKPQGVLADDTLLALGNLYLEDLDQPAQAQAAYQRLAVDFPLSEFAAQAKRGYGLALFRQGRWDQAREIFDAERKTKGGPNPNAPPTELDRLITACDTKKGPLLAGSAGAKFLRGPLTLNKQENKVAIGDTYFIAMDYTKAARAYEKVLRATPGSEEAAYCLLQAGRCYNQLRNYQKALTCYGQFLDKYRGSQWADGALLRAGVIYVGPLRQSNKGAEMYQTILERYPNGKEADLALFHLATLSFWKKDWNRALTLYQDLLRRYPQSRCVKLVKETQIPAVQAQLNVKPAA